MEVFRSERTVAMAEWVKGEVIARSESFVTCDFKAVEEADRRGRALSLFGDSATAGFAEGGDRVV